MSTPWFICSLVAAGTGLSLVFVLRRQWRRRVLEPLGELRQAVCRAARQEDRKVRLSHDCGGEVGALIHCVNGMLEALAEREHKLDRQREMLETEIATHTAELRNLNRQLTAAKDKAEAAARLKNEFLANISHEIRTPMNGIIGLTEITLQGRLAPEQRQNLLMVKDSAEQLLALLDDIIDFSRIEAGKVLIEHKPFDLERLLSETLQIFSVRAHCRNIDLLLVMDLATPTRLVGDKERLRQVLSHLVGNAVKFTQNGEVQLSVNVEEAAAEGMLLRFSVRDTGIGIPRDRQQAIFEAFTQADGSNSRRFGGAGLGLAISRRLTQLMGGELSVESEPGKGSTFYFGVRFGLALDDYDPKTNVSPATGMRILVAEGHPVCRQQIVARLRHWRGEVSEAGTLEEAARWTENVQPPADLALVDAHLEEDDAGIELAVRLARSRAARRLVLMLQPGENQSLRRRAREAGIGEFIFKPVTPAALRDLLATQRTRTSPSLPLSNTAAQPARPLRILVAEDNPVNQRVAVRLLQKKGHQVQVAANGAEAVQALSMDPFDLVLMDIQMPVMDGLEATAHIRQQDRQRGRHTPVIALTAHCMKSDEEQCLAAGMDGFLTKPVDPSALYLTIERVLS